ncbi:MAG TPA: hypothetical protein VFG04_14295 [Planctomycetaceae bacterium]|jgi:hypothetical protein|nr:hypothetical protein [Planctomycetaceae bacterium]
MSGNQDARGHEMMYLATGIAIGALGASLAMSDNGARRRLTHAMGMETPKPSGFLWPWGALLAGGAVAAGLTAMAPEIARYIKIESM